MPIIAVLPGNANLIDPWVLSAHNVRSPDHRLDLDDLFLFEAKRCVMKDRTVSLHGRLYEVHAVLVGQSVTLRYDPDAPPSRPIEVVHDAKPAGTSTRLDAYANTAVKRHRGQRQLFLPPTTSAPAVCRDRDSYLSRFSRSSR